MRLRVLTVAVAVSLPFSVFPLQTASAAPDDGGYVLRPSTGPVGTWLTASDNTGTCRDAAHPDAHGMVLSTASPSGGRTLAREFGALDQNGEWQVRLQVPAATAPGDYAVLASCVESKESERAPFKVFRVEIFTVTAGPAVTEPAPDGTFQLSRTSGPAGTVVTVSDADGDCVVPAGAPAPQVEVQLLDQGAVATERWNLPANASFSVPLTIPANLAPAPRYAITVSCYTSAPDVAALNNGLEPYQYMSRTFAVTGPSGQGAAAAPTAAQPVANARPATAVAGQPRFTG